MGQQPLQSRRCRQPETALLIGSQEDGAGPCQLLAHGLRQQQLVMLVQPGRIGPGQGQKRAPAWVEYPSGIWRGGSVSDWRALPPTFPLRRGEELEACISP